MFRFRKLSLLVLLTSLAALPLSGRPAPVHPGVATLTHGDHGRAATPWEIRWEGLPPAWRTQALEAFDSNANGILEPTERVVLRETWRAAAAHYAAHRPAPR